MTRLHLDFETRSMLDIRKVGVDRYARNAEVLMLAWAFDNDEPQLWIPEKVNSLSNFEMEVYRALQSDGVEKTAWNKRFEQLVFLHALKLRSQGPWLDPAVLARSGTLPGSLEGASKYLNLGHLAKAAEEGKRLIKKFSVPYKGKFRAPEDHPEDFKLFGEYCKQDVRAEREVLHKIEKLFPLTPFEQKVEKIDEIINHRGVPIDMQFVREAHKLVEAEKANLRTRMKHLTSLENPNSKPQLLGWLREHGYPFSSMGKAKIEEAVRTLEDWVKWPNAEVGTVLALHQKLSRSSTSKLEALINRTADDGILRHSYKYLGADRTGRWSGEGFQPQNLPRA